MEFGPSFSSVAYWRPLEFSEIQWARWNIVNNVLNPVYLIKSVYYTRLIAKFFDPFPGKSVTQAHLGVHYEAILRSR